MPSEMSRISISKRIWVLSSIFLLPLLISLDIVIGQALIHRDERLWINSLPVYTSKIHDSLTNVPSSRPCEKESGNLRNVLGHAVPDAGGTQGPPSDKPNFPHTAEYVAVFRLGEEKENVASSNAESTQTNLERLLTNLYFPPSMASLGLTFESPASHGWDVGPTGVQLSLSMHPSRQAISGSHREAAGVCPGGRLTRKEWDSLMEAVCRIVGPTFAWRSASKLEQCSPPKGASWMHGFQGEDAAWSACLDALVPPPVADGSESQRDLKECTARATSADDLAGDVGLPKTPTKPVCSDEGTSSGAQTMNECMASCHMALGEKSIFSDMMWLQDPVPIELMRTATVVVEEEEGESDGAHKEPTSRQQMKGGIYTKRTGEGGEACHLAPDVGLWQSAPQMTLDRTALSFFSWSRDQDTGGSGSLLQAWLQERRALLAGHLAGPLWQVQRSSLLLERGPRRGTGRAEGRGGGVTVTFSEVARASPASQHAQKPPRSRHFPSGHDEAAAPSDLGPPSSAVDSSSTHARAPDATLPGACDKQPPHSHSQRDCERPASETETELMADARWSPRGQPHDRPGDAEGGDTWQFLKHVPSSSASNRTGGEEWLVMGLRRTLIGQGSHRELRTFFELYKWCDVEMPLQQEGGEAASEHSGGPVGANLTLPVTVMLVEHLPSGVFADTFELQQLEGVDVQVYGCTDLERPSPQSRQSLVTLQTRVELALAEPCRAGKCLLKGDVQVALPLHARYPAVVPQSCHGGKARAGAGLVHFALPHVFASRSCRTHPQCPDLSARGCGCGLEHKSMKNVEFMWLKAVWAHTSDDVGPIWNIPAGRMAHAYWVSCITALAAAFGAVFLSFPGAACAKK